MWLHRHTLVSRCVKNLIGSAFSVVRRKDFIAAPCVAHKHERLQYFMLKEYPNTREPCWCSIYVDVAYHQQTVVPRRLPESVLWRTPIRIHSRFPLKRRRGSGLLSMCWRKYNWLQQLEEKLSEKWWKKLSNLIIERTIKDWWARRAYMMVRIVAEQSHELWFWNHGIKYVTVKHCP